MYDALGNGFKAGATVVGFGLHNAGRYYTLAEIRGQRGRLIEHLTGRTFWTFLRYHRMAEGR